MSGGKRNSNDKAARGANPDRLAASLAFDGSVTQVRAVSGARAAALGKMGIHTVRDLITHFPRRYIDMSAVSTIAQAQIGESCTIMAKVFEVKLKQPKRNLSLVEVTLNDGTDTMIVTCFRQPWLAERLHRGDWLAVSGKVEFNYEFKRMTNPFMEDVAQGGDASGMIVPVHPATEKVNTAWMRRLVSNALETCVGLEDPLPLDLRLRYRLMSRQSALRVVHFPTSMDEAKQARRRLAYEELLLLELHLMMRNQAGGEDGAYVQHVVDGPCVDALLAALPFRLTDEQEQARRRILEVMATPRRANHMLLGDVGTGKTAVAAFALAAAADTGTQALMMAPTEVLALQYGNKVGPLLEKAGVRWALLTGSTSSADRETICAALRSGELSVLFGTHALLESDVVASDCSVVVIDEQQRFGVEQRAALKAKGDRTDVISLTATPIPRSLALALYGDMTMSYIRHRPGNRAAAVTKVYSYAQRGDAYEVALDELEQGRQVYVVCPLVGEAKPSRKGKKAGESEEEQDDYEFANIAIEQAGDFVEANVRAALQHAEYLRDKVFCGYEVAVLHGKMKSSEKHEVMQAFREKRVEVLVSTTVIEVGVDVPNATVMIVEDADRFGLAQLHQLRGRVGRGAHCGYTCLVSGTKAPAALERLAAMERTDDGFELAEYDLSLRREGDILGNRQHGASVLKLVNVVRDSAIVEVAHADAAELLDCDPGLRLPEHQALRYELARVFHQGSER